MHFKIEIDSAQPVAEVLECLQVQDSTSPASGRGARVSASAGLNNQLQSCLLNPGIAWQIADKVVVKFTIRKKIYNGNYLMTMNDNIFYLHKKIKSDTVRSP